MRWAMPVPPAFGGNCGVMEIKNKRPEGFSKGFLREIEPASCFCVLYFTLGYYPACRAGSKSKAVQRQFLPLFEQRMPWFTQLLQPFQNAGSCVSAS